MESHQTGYNYGIINNNGTHGQNISGEEANGYNYGIINNNGNFGQMISGKSSVGI